MPAGRPRAEQPAVLEEGVGNNPQCWKALSPAPPPADSGAAGGVWGSEAKRCRGMGAVKASEQQRLVRVVLRRLRAVLKKPIFLYLM